jgi:hypothetical protein
MSDLFIVGKEMILCYGKHSNLVVHSKAKAPKLWLSGFMLQHFPFMIFVYDDTFVDSSCMTDIDLLDHTESV